MKQRFIAIYEQHDEDAYKTPLKFRCVNLFDHEAAKQPINDVLVYIVAAHLGMRIDF